MPLSDIIFNNISFSSRNYLMLDAGIPKSLMQLTLYGNELGEVYDLGMNNSLNIFSENSFGYSKKIKNISLGGRIKYLQGLAYGEFINLSDNSAYFYTDSTGLLGKAEYLINQGVGGSGFAMDIGVIYEKYEKDWKFGISLNNLFGKINWDDSNITYNFLRNSIIKKLPLRHNEKQYFSINLDTLNAISMLDMSIDEIYMVENFPVIEFKSLDYILFEINQEISEDGDTILTSEYGNLIFTEYGSYLLPSENLSDSLITSFDLDINKYKTDYPTYFNFTAQKSLEEDISICFDLSTGFSNSLRNSKKWKFSTGLLFNRFEG